MPGLSNTGCLGVLTINSLAAACPAWDIPTDIGQLWNSRSIRGKNRVVGGASGRRAKRMRYDEAEFTLGLIVVGDVDENGDPHSDPLEGLVANQDTMMAAWVHPIADGGAATLTASLTIPGQSARTAEVQCELEFGRPTVRSGFQAFAPGALTLVIPTPGYFA